MEFFQCFGIQKTHIFLECHSVIIQAVSQQKLKYIIKIHHRKGEKFWNCIFATRYRVFAEIMNSLTFSPRDVTPYLTIQDQTWHNRSNRQNRTEKYTNKRTSNITWLARIEININGSGSIPVTSFQYCYKKPYIPSKRNCHFHITLVSKLSLQSTIHWVASVHNSVIIFPMQFHFHTLSRSLNIKA